MSQYNISLCVISESWDRQNNPIEDNLKIDNFRVLKNIVQRKNRGGKPILVISEKKIPCQGTLPRYNYSANRG